jgi:hypothetical protein
MSASEAEHKLAPIRREGYFGGAGLLASDARVVSLFADEARRRLIQRLFGIPRTDKSGLVSLIALLTLADAARRQMEGISAPSPPTLPGVMFGIGLVKESAYRVAGPAARQSPYFGTLLALALMGATVRLGVRASTRGVRSLSHQARSEFDHRYGHLVRPNRAGLSRRRRATAPGEDHPKADT